MSLKCKRFVEGSECLDRMREKQQQYSDGSIKSPNHTAHLRPLKGGKGRLHRHGQTTELLLTM